MEGLTYNLSDDEVETVIRSLQALYDEVQSHVEGSPTKLQSDLFREISDLAKRIAHHTPLVSLGELRNICFGLDLLLDASAMDWKASQLLAEFRVLCGYTRPEL